MPLGDDAFLRHGVACKLDHLAAIDERCWHCLETVCGADESHLRKIQRQIHVVIFELGVLLRVEKLEKG